MAETALRQAKATLSPMAGALVMGLVGLFRTDFDYLNIPGGCWFKYLYLCSEYLNIWFQLTKTSNSQIIHRGLNKSSISIV